MKKRWTMVSLTCLLLLSSCGDKALPKPENEEGYRGEMFGIDAHINEKTIDQYLFRSDTVYRDMRLLYDPADYEAIGGDSYLSGFVEGFEVVPFPYICSLDGLPPEVGTGYDGPTLYTGNAETGYVAQYEESLTILENLFPHDKNIFLMCGGGGYAGMMKSLLLDLGWDPNTIYNVGGYWYYDGEHDVQVKREKEDGSIVYDFYKVAYHELDFDEYTRIES